MGKLREAHPDWMKDHGLSFLHWCPGCKTTHVINVEKPNGQDALWTFDGNMEAPTFSPSINRGPGHCHYFIRAGRIEFQGDSQHTLAGQTVDLPDLEQAEAARDAEHETLNNADAESASTDAPPESGPASSTADTPPDVGNADADKAAAEQKAAAEKAEAEKVAAAEAERKAAEEKAAEEKASAEKSSKRKEAEHANGLPSWRRRRRRAIENRRSLSRSQ